MSDKRVVLGIGYSQSMDIGAEIEGEFSKVGLEDAECVLAHTKASVETFLKRDSSIVGVILLRDMSVSSPYTAREIVLLAESFPKVVFVPICIETYKGSGFAQDLLDGGVYNMVFNCDSSIETIVGRIVKPFGRKDARRYYGLIGEVDKGNPVMDGAVLTDENYYSYLSFLQNNETPLLEKIDYIKGLLDVSTFRTLLLRLPEELKDKVSKEPGYEDFYININVEEKQSNKKREKKEKPVKEIRDKKEIKDAESFFEKATGFASSVFGTLGSELKGLLSDDVGEDAGLKKLIALSQREFDSLERTLADELSAKGAETVCDVEPQISTVDILEEQIETVCLEVEEADADGDSLVEVVTLDADTLDASISVGQVRTESKTESVRNKVVKEERSRHEKKERVKQVYIGSVVIAVASIKKGIGCSHVARALANYMCQVEKRHVCFIDCERTLYAAPEGLLAGIDVMPYAELAIAYGRYDCIVMDLGTSYQSFHQEIIRATIKVMCCTADDTVIENLYKFMKKDQEPFAWVYAFNHVLAKARVKRVEELMEDYNYIFIPACGEEELPKAFVKDLKRVLSNRKRR